MNLVVEVKRRRGESFESLLRRFSKRVQQSGRILQAKKIRFHAPKKSRNATRKSALRRIEIATKREYMIKSGKMVEEDFARKPRRPSR